jgi:hypothetical protein
MAGYYPKNTSSTAAKHGSNQRAFGMAQIPMENDDVACQTLSFCGK